MSRQKVFITGASGFTGQHLRRYLETQSVEITTFSLRDSRFFDSASLRALLQEAQPDYIIHLAGIASASAIKDYFRTNAVLATELLHAAREAGLGDRPFLLVGTAAEYGQVEAHDLPIDEETTCRPLSYYGISKLAQTHVGLAAARMNAQPVIVARPFNIIGHGLPEHLALGAFQKQIAEIKMGRRPPKLLVGNLESTRDFIAVEDIVRLYWALLQNDSARGQVVNLCTGIPTSMRFALDCLIAASGREIEVEIEPSRLKSIDVPANYGSNARLLGLLGDFVFTPVEDSIRKIAQ